MAISYSVVVDRPLGVFDLYLTYFIDGYNDPETGEYFGDTSWSISSYKITGESLGGYGGYGPEGDTIFLSLFSPGGPVAMQGFRFDFQAQNLFSGVTDTLTWNALIAPESTSAEIIVGTAKSDIVISGAGADIIQTQGGNDVIYAGYGNDLIDAGNGADEIDGEGGADVMAGGPGDDIYHVDNILDVAAERPGEGNDTIISRVSVSLQANVERLILSGPLALVGTGTTAADRIDGNEFANTLMGLEGNDRLFGLGGNDSLIGDNGQDELDGGQGNDTMAGGAGADTYFVDSLKDRVIETAGPDTDLVVAIGLSSYALTAHVEDLTTIGAGNFRGIGNELANKITGGKGNDTLEGLTGNDSLIGNDGNDILIGGPGADFLSGGNGIDTASYATSAFAVDVNLGTSTFKGGDAAGDGMLGIENVIGSNGNDVLIGNAIANRLSGGAGNDRIDGALGDDVIIGGPGADTLNGGVGVDTVSYANSTEGAIDVDLAKQLGTALGGDAQGDELHNFENVVGGAGNDRIAGDDFANVLMGGLGDDTISGAGGNDVMIGGGGADSMDGGGGVNTLSYAGDTVGVEVIMAASWANGGDATGDSFVNIANVRGGHGDDRLVGDAGNNLLIGGEGNDTLDGGEGNDILIGGVGADTINGGIGVDTLSYAGAKVSGVSVSLTTRTGFASDAEGDVFSGIENLTGSDFGDFLQGDAEDNTLLGGAGFDVLDGKGGNDRLSGGDQADLFYFGIGYGKDIITDFQAGLASDDLIEFQLGGSFDSFAEVMAVAKSVGPLGQHTALVFDAHTSLTLFNVSKVSLTASDFQFV